MFSVIASFFMALCFWLIFSLSLRLFSDFSRSEAPQKISTRSHLGERAFHSPLLLIVVGMMSFFMFPMFLMFIESAEKQESFKIMDLTYVLLFLVTAVISFFYFVREQGAKQ